MKRWYYLIVAVAFIAGGIISIAIAQPDNVTIDNKYPSKIKTPVTLSHKLHIDKGVACTDCHHTWKKEEAPAPKKCAECHKAGDKGATGLKNAYHTNCMDCHKELKSAGKPTGPTFKCSECHTSE